MLRNPEFSQPFEGSPEEAAALQRIHARFEKEINQRANLVPLNQEEKKTELIAAEWKTGNNRTPSTKKLKNYMPQRRGPTIMEITNDPSLLGNDYQKPETKLTSE